MYFRNGKIFIDGEFQTGGFLVENGRFRNILTGNSGGEADPNAVDLNGAYVIPGLVDIHIHGAAGEDFSSCDADGLMRMAKYLASRGVTSFLPTAMTLPKEDYLWAAENIALIAGEGAASENASGNTVAARILGMRMEGPFLSAKKKGAQNEAFLQKPDAEMFKEISEKSGGRVMIIDVAPEVEGADSFIREVVSSGDAESEIKLRPVISVGHSAATYEEAMKAFLLGAGHVTHLFNAMNPFHHREPGIIPAAAENKAVTAEIISDGIHVHESAVRMAFNLFPDRICIVSDALSCLGVPDGEYMLSGQKIIKSGGVARLEDGTLAGAASDIYDGMRNAIRFGIPVETAILAASRLPADIIGNKDVGAIEVGRYADFIVCDEKLNLKEVYIGGILCQS